METLSDDDDEDEDGRRRGVDDREKVCEWEVEAIEADLKRRGIFDGEIEMLKIILQRFADCTVGVGAEKRSAATIWLRLLKEASTLAEGTSATEVRLRFILHTEEMIERVRRKDKTLTPNTKIAEELRSCAR